MTDLGYALSSEEHGPRELVRLAQRAEAVGFSFAMISDHFHPWIDQQGQSPFVWSVIGAVAQATHQLRLGTGVTCPIIRIHPAIVAQAAATAEAMMPGRFFLGVGSGENLNEHILGDRWPPTDVRQEMLEEAVGLIRRLWEGELTTHRGRYFTVENARLYTLPEQPPPLLMAASGPESARLAARVADGLISVTPSEQVVGEFRASAGGERPRYGQVTVCWAETEEEGRRIAHSWWPNAGLKGPLSSELPVPAHFQQASAMVTEADVAQVIVCGPDPKRHIEQIARYAEAGYDHVYVHQVGPQQEGFFDFYQREVLPEFR
ncbi:MAG: TIGR03557 family F420-dependent LLM class oxidoreductase [Actinomycetota bacterium]|nr:TIGR03557 family F420-dependent LLM class oxidoreductase [Actinomycetota bacterium]